MALSGRQLAKESGTSEAAVRRYAEWFPGFLPVDRRGRWPRYPEECVETVRAIHSMFREGMSRDEIRDALARNYPQTIELEPVKDAPAPVPAQPAGDLVEALRLALETVADQRQAMAMMAQRMEAQENRIQALEEKVEAMAALPAPDTKKPRPDVQERDRIKRRVMELHDKGLSLREVAAAMDLEGWPTLSGRGKWGHGAVKRVLEKQPRRERGPVKNPKSFLF